MAGKVQAAGHRRADMAKDICAHRDLAVEVDAEDAMLVGSWREEVDKGFWMLEVAERDRSERSGSYPGSLVVDQAVSVAKRHMDSGGREYVCLAPHGKVAEDFPGTGRDERLATRFDAYHGPSVMLGHRSHDGTQSVHLRQMYPEIQQKDVEDRKQWTLPVSHNDHSRPLGTTTSETCPWGRACRALPPYGQAIPLSCATYLADLFGLRTHQHFSAVVCSAVVERLGAAMASEVVVPAMAVQWLVEWAR